MLTSPLDVYATPNRGADAAQDNAELVDTECRVAGCGVGRRRPV